MHVYEYGDGDGDADGICMHRSAARLAAPIPAYPYASTDTCTRTFACTLGRIKFIAAWTSAHSCALPSGRPSVSACTAQRRPEKRAPPRVLAAYSCSFLCALMCSRVNAAVASRSVSPCPLRLRHDTCDFASWIYIYIYIYICIALSICIYIYTHTHMSIYLSIRRGRGRLRRCIRARRRCCVSYTLRIYRALPV